MNYLGILFHCRFCFPGSGMGPETSISQTSQVMLVLLVHGLGAASIMLPCTIHVSLLCCSVAKLCLTLCDRVDCSTPGSSVFCYLPEFPQIFVPWFGDAIQPSHSLLSPSQSFPASRSFPMSLLFASGSQSTGASASVLPMNIQSWFSLGLTSLISLLSKGLSRVFSNTIQKHQFFGAQPSLWSNLHIHTWLLEKP